MPILKHSHRSAEDLSTSPHTIKSNKLVSRTVSVRLSSNHQRASSFIKRLTAQSEQAQVPGANKTPEKKQETTPPSRKNSLPRTRLRKTPPTINDSIYATIVRQQKERFDHAQTHETPQNAPIEPVIDTPSKKETKMNGGQEATMGNTKRDIEKPFRTLTFNEEAKRAKDHGASPEDAEDRPETIYVLETAASPGHFLTLENSSNSTPNRDSPWTTKEEQAQMEWKAIRLALRTDSAEDISAYMCDYQGRSHVKRRTEPWVRSYKNFFPPGLRHAHQDTVVERVMREQKRREDVIAVLRRQA